jgi:hypothetical protein
MKLLNLAGIAVIVALFVSWLSIAFYPSAQDFMRANPFWNGLRDFSERFEADMAASIDQPTGQRGDGVLIAIPYLPYSDEELARIADFVGDGGNLLLMDDYGYGNQVLSALGLDMEFSGEPLLDPYVNYRNQWLPLATDLAPELREAGIEQLKLNHATALSVRGSYQVLAWSSDTAYLDRNRNETWDEGEIRGPLPLAARATVGQGTVAVVSDPSILINSMVGRGDNAAFLRHIIRQAGDDPWIAIDISHLPNMPLDRSKSAWEMARERMAYPYSQTLLVGAVLSLILLPLWRKGANLEPK